MLKNWLKKRVSEKGTVNSQRRGLLSKIVVGSGLLATASHLQTKTKNDAELRFPDDPIENNIIYQFNKIKLNFFYKLINT